MEVTYSHGPSYTRCRTIEMEPYWGLYLLTDFSHSKFICLIFCEFFYQVADVCDFIRKLPGCCDYVEDFAIQEIDGQALLLLKEDHLMSAMSMKLGPALKICARIDTLRNIAEGGGSGGQQPTAAAGGQTVGGGQPQLPAPEK